MAFVSSTFAPYVPPLKERILLADDKVVQIFYSNLGSCQELISKIEYTAASVSPTAKATKTFTYSDTTYRYNVSSVIWTVVP